jgi:hypothetical protein
MNSCSYSWKECSKIPLILSFGKLHRCPFTKLSSQAAKFVPFFKICAPNPELEQKLLEGCTKNAAQKTPTQPLVTVGAWVKTPK